MKLFFVGGGEGFKGRGWGGVSSWIWSGAVSKLSGLPYLCVCYRSKLHSGNNYSNNHHHHHLGTMINDLIINDNN